MGPALLAGVFGAGVYGGYFGAAQGVLLLALLGICLDDDLQRQNAVKNVLATVANLVSGLVFAVVAPVSWPSSRPMPSSASSSTPCAAPK